MFVVNKNPVKRFRLKERVYITMLVADRWGSNVPRLKKMGFE